MKEKLQIHKQPLAIISPSFHVCESIMLKAPQQQQQLQ